jgi:hypothetical protein
MKFYGKAHEVANLILEQFKSGNVPAILKAVFVHRSDNLPSSSWSFQNQFIQAIHGTNDARGFKQWKGSGRRVKKGSKSFHILGPCLKKITDEDGEEKQALLGFKSIPVFAIEKTEEDASGKWDATGIDQEEENRLATLPLHDVAEAWGIAVKSYNGKGSKYYGYYRYSYTGSQKSIALGVQNLSTWTHELVHAADHKNGTLKGGHGQDAGNEIVAELGGAVILHLLGEEVEADLGGAWSYIKRYSQNDPDKAIAAATRLLDRTCKAVALILEAHDENNTGSAKAA